MGQDAKQNLILKLPNLPVAQAQLIIFKMQALGTCVVLEGVEQEEQDLRDMQGGITGRVEDPLQQVLPSLLYDQRRRDQPV